MTQDHFDSGLISEVIRLAHEGLVLVSTSISEPHNLMRASLNSCCLERILFNSKIDIDLPRLMFADDSSSSSDIEHLIISGDFQQFVDQVGKDRFVELRSQLANYFLETLSLIGIEGLK